MEQKLLVLLIKGNWRHTWQWTQRKHLTRPDAYKFCGCILGVPKRNSFYLITAFWIINFSITNNYFPDWRKPLAWSGEYFWSMSFFCFPLPELILLSSAERVSVSVKPCRLVWACTKPFFTITAEIPTCSLTNLSCQYADRQFMREQTIWRFNNLS